MTRSQKRRFLLVAVVGLIGGLIGYVYTSLSYRPGAPDAASPLRGVRVGILIAASGTAFEVMAMRGPIGRWLKRLPVLPSFVVRTLIYTGLISAILQLNVRIISLSHADFSGVYRFDDMVRDVTFSLAATAAIIFVIQMRQLIGPRTFRNLLSGRYHSPRREERIFVIFDIVGSTAAAERLGDERFHAFVSQVFFDIDAPIVDHGGEVMSFVGDALIADWPLLTRERNGQAVRAALDVMDVLHDRASAYEARFGFTPRLRAVLHGGPVIAGETGDSRRQITYLGDVLNIASRIEGVAKGTGTQIAISDSLLVRSALPEDAHAEPLGEFPVKGAERPVAISAIVRDAGRGE